MRLGDCQTKAYRQKGPPSGYGALNRWAAIEVRDGPERMRHARQLKEIADFEESIAARKMYAFVRTSLDQDRSKTGKGKDAERFSCPAQAGKVVGTNCPLSMAGPADLPRVLNPPAEPGLPDACMQRTISVPMTVIPKLPQRER
jgi:hypothetical protein